MAFSFAIYCSLIWLALSCLSVASSYKEYPRISRRQSQGFNSTGVLDVFQVYQPVQFDASGTNGCNKQLVLVEHTFASSYGQPFVGEE